MMAQTTISTATVPCTLTGGAHVWTFADTVPSAIGPTEAPIDLITLADIPPGRLRMWDVWPGSSPTLRHALARAFVQNAIRATASAARDLRTLRRTIEGMAR